MAGEQNQDVTRALSTFGAPPITYRTFGMVTVQPIPLAGPPMEPAAALPVLDEAPPPVASEAEAAPPAALPPQDAAPWPEAPALRWVPGLAGGVATLPQRVAAAPAAVAARTERDGPRVAAFAPSIPAAWHQATAPAAPSPAPSAALAGSAWHTFPMAVPVAMQAAVPMPPSAAAVVARTDIPEGTTELRDLFRFLAEGVRTPDIVPHIMTLPGVFRRM